MKTGKKLEALMKKTFKKIVIKYTKCLDTS